MKGRSLRLRFIIVVLIGSAAGLLLPFITPDHWWNLAFMPLYASWFTLPTDLMFILLCNIFRIDWLSDAANKVLLTTMQAVSSCIMGASYSITLYALYALVRKASGKPISRGDLHETSKGAT
jgi:hypothetical protein